MTEKTESASELLQQMTMHEGDTITIGEMVTIFKVGGFSLLLLVFAGPLALPLPAVGIASVMSIPMLFISIQLAIGKSSLWLPERISNKQLSMLTLNKVIGKMIPFLHKIEYLVRPRFRFFASRAGQCLVGVTCTVCSIFVAMPIPFSNTVPSAGIVIMCIGLLERDGIAILAGMCVGIAGMALTIIAYYFGIEVVIAAFSGARDWLGF